MRRTGANAGRAVIVMALGAILTGAACGDKSKTPPDTATKTGAPAGGGLSEPKPGTPPAGATPQTTAIGDSIFHGEAAGGLCFTCHGPDAKGGPLAPPLVSHKWISGDGSYEFIQDRVTKGMPNPTPPYTSPMLPMGGAQLTPDQIKAVAAYVYSISR